MKVTLMMFLVMAGLTQGLRAQTSLDKVIDLPRPSLSVEELIQEIKKQSTFYFSYSNKLPLSQKITFPEKKLTIAEILIRIKQQTGINYQVKEGKIILMVPSKKYTVSGYLRDAISGESLIGGSIYTLPSMQGTTTNNFGYFSLTLSKDSIHLIISYTGYQTTNLRFLLTADTVILVDQAVQTLGEVVITAKENDYNPELTQMSAFDIPVQQLKSLPALAGEADIMKSLQLLPGVQSGNEGTSGLYVRGGGPDQNLILLDGVPVYNASHFFGFFSVFNADAVNHVELIKGGFPARYGGRLSSVIDINMKEGNREELKGEGSVGLIASRFTLEGPLKKDRASFIFSARRTYADLLARPIIKYQTKGDVAGYYFYDLNTKFNYIVSNRSRLYLSAYSGKDRGFSHDKDSFTDQGSGQKRSFDDDAELSWGNMTSALRWNYVLTPNVFSNLTATFSKYNFKIFSENDMRVFNADGTQNMLTSRYVKSVYSSSIHDYGIKWDLDFTPSPGHYAKFGTYAIHHRFLPGAATVRSSADSLRFNAGRILTLEFGAYAEDDIVITKKVKANVGVHFSGSSVEEKTFLSLQPRVSVRYLVNERFSVKASYADMAQYIHLLTNAGVGLPTDLWVPATSRIKPQRSQQIAAGISYVPDPMFEVTVESYHKRMDGVIEYKDGATYLNTRNDWQDKVEIGKGESYGAELFVQKKLGKWKGWLGYTLSRTYREFSEINFGKKFPYRYDRRHDIEITLSREITKRTNLSAVWVYATGNAISLHTAVYGGYASGNGTPRDYIYYEGFRYYEGRNSFRMSPNHRLDLSLTFKKTKKWGERSWVIGIYNAYSRNNPFYVNFATDHKTNTRRLYQYGLFPIIPSFSYNFKF